MRVPTDARAGYPEPIEPRHLYDVLVELLAHDPRPRTDQPVHDE
ncbi:MAG TPA: hypothetical protein VGG06_21640 [Thermoanaerobaculia bacterium]